MAPRPVKPAKKDQKKKIKVNLRGYDAIEHVYDDDFEGEYEFDEFDRLDEVEIDEEELDDPNKARAQESEEFWQKLKSIEAVMGPIMLTVLGFAVRVYRIGINPTVVWDEAHFGKFGSYYLRHEFYHDVHPPLGKMLVGLSGYLAGYNGSWDFPSGEEYPKEINFISMRLFQAVFSTACVPLAYLTAKELHYGLLPCYLFSILVALESSYVTLARFILLDAMLLCFTVSTMYLLVRFHNTRHQPFSKKWWNSLLLLGISMGCVNSVKMVGLFVTALVGIYTVAQLWKIFGDKSTTSKAYFFHWIARIFALIVVPLSVFMLCFKIHFELLWHSGTGDATMSSLFQAHLVGSNVAAGPRDVAFTRSKITIKNHAGGLLHSHIQKFPVGSLEQQVTTYAHKDSNNDWTMSAPSSQYQDLQFITPGEQVNLFHSTTGARLHTHKSGAPITSKYYEVSAYNPALNNEEYDAWLVDLVDQYGTENKSRIHPLTTTFRLKNNDLNCYLGVSGANLPEWGFSQGEVVCIEAHKIDLDDPRILWNVENHENPELETTSSFKVPKPGFLKNFIELNKAMMATNNALIPDPEKLDQLASKWWEWPTLHTGIRLCGWEAERHKYYLVGSPATTWTSTLAVIFFPVILCYYLLRWQRQVNDFVEPRKFDNLLMRGVYPMLGWGLHFMPFVVMGRVTYVHHYLPALYFAMLVYVYVFDLTVSQFKGKLRVFYYLGYILNYALIISVFYILSPLSFGMEGDNNEFKYLNWVPSWKVSDEKLWEWPLWS